MATGEYVSVASQTELIQAEIAVERAELLESPVAEEAELAALYRARGLTPELAREVARQLSADPEQVWRVHAREELGIDPDDLPSPYLAAGSSFVAFAVGALVPLLPYFFGVQTLLWSLVLTAVALFAAGTAVAQLTTRSWVFAGSRQLALGVWRRRSRTAWGCCSARSTSRSSAAELPRAQVCPSCNLIAHLGPSSSHTASPHRTTSQSRRQEPGPHVLCAPRAPQGLYDGLHEHDACGVAFVADITGRQSHDVVAMGITALNNLEHRGATGAEENTGDGAGILVQVPDAFLRQAVAFALPAAGGYAVGNAFLPIDDQDADDKAAAQIADIAQEEGLEVLGWRDVPVEPVDPRPDGPRRDAPHAPALRQGHRRRPT